MHRKYEVTVVTDAGEFRIEVNTKFGKFSAERMARNSLLRQWGLDGVVFPGETKDLGPDTTDRTCKAGSCPIPAREEPHA